MVNNQNDMVNKFNYLIVNIFTSIESGIRKAYRVGIIKIYIL